MLEAQARIVSAWRTCAGPIRERTIVLVSHGDVIKAALIYHLGLAARRLCRFDIDPASVSTLVVGDGARRCFDLNEVAYA